MMNRFSILLSLVGLLSLSAGCKKSSVPVNISIEGTWELRKIEANLTINYSPGNGKILQFTGTDFKLIDNGLVTDSGKYKLIFDESVVVATGISVTPGTFNHRIEYNNNPSLNKVFIDISNNTLSFLTGAAGIYDSQARYIYSRK